MADINTVTVSCMCQEEIRGAVNAVNRTLPLDIRKRLNKIYSAYLHRFGEAGVFERLNNRTVAQIFAEYNPADDPKPIASGELDGVRYALYDPPSTGQSKRDSATSG